jgi:hypothetical protein
MPVKSSSNLTAKAVDVFGDLGAIERLGKDLKGSVKTLNRDEVRTLVDYYYIIQDNRKAANNQISQLEKTGEPHALLRYVHKQADILEAQIKNAMNFWTEEHPVASIVKNSVCGIGPIIAAGLIAHLDVHRAKTAGGFWRYAGLDPSSQWLSRDKVRDWVKNNKDIPVEDLVFRAATFFGRNADTLRRMASSDKDGKPTPMTYETLTKAISLRPYNASLKTLCWKMGDCFMKFSKKQRKLCPSCGEYTIVKVPGDSEGEEEEQVDCLTSNCKHCKEDLSSVVMEPACFYGYIYRKQKQHLIGLNQSGNLSKTAADTLAKKNIQDPKTLATYKGGMLSDGHIDGMARRFAVKLFLSNLHELWCAIEGIPCPQPYSMAHLGHAHYICQPEIADAIKVAKDANRQSLSNPMT